MQILLYSNHIVTSIREIFHHTWQKMVLFISKARLGISRKYWAKLTELTKLGSVVHYTQLVWLCLTSRTWVWWTGRIRNWIPTFLPRLLFKNSFLTTLYHYPVSSLVDRLINHKKIFKWRYICKHLRVDIDDIITDMTSQIIHSFIFCLQYLKLDIFLDGE